ncbi:histone H3.v1 isoform X5 [Oryzias latipes]|uniref:histone H3.v1 isoform X5 n=1 Tax=Oryzias latipes TaxID=8090 RepID=UPI000CE1DCC0|nr:histone H3.v1 isoform X5 [Oryzias latipes]
MSSEPQEGSVREQLSAAEGTIVQNEEELCRQRRLLDISWNPQLQLHIAVLPQHWMTEEEDLCNQQTNVRVEQEDPEPLNFKEEQEEPVPPEYKEEQQGVPEPQEYKEELEEPVPPEYKEEQEEQELSHYKEEQQGLPEPLPDELFFSQDEDQLDLK